MRISRSLPIAIGCSILLLTGVADATSTTCTTSTVCAEYVDSSSGVAVHGEANTGIGVRGTSNTSTGFYGASRSGNFLFTQKSTAGFVVREAHGGRSTMAFEYRILAKPIDENGVRLAVAPPLPHGDPLARYARVHQRNAPVAEPLDAFARLKMKLGPTGYARALAAARQNQIGR